MSTATQHHLKQPVANNPSRSQLWCWAAVSPLLIAPIWLGFSTNTLGPLHSLSGLVLVLLIVCSAVTDVQLRKIFNWTTYTAFAWAIAINLLPASLASITGAIGISNCLSSGVICFGLMLIPYCLARGGAGDVKLAAAIGALIGLDAGLLVIAFAYIIAAITIAGWTIWSKGPLALFAAMFRKFGAKLFPFYVSVPTKQQSVLLDQPIPLAGFFAIATVLVVFDVPSVLGAF